jgi:lactate racemase
MASQALSKCTSPTGRICIAIPDSTRKLDLRVAFEALKTWLARDAQVTVIVGLGLHRNSTPLEMAALQAISPWPVQDHDPMSCRPLPTESTLPAGLPDAVLQADALIAVGTIELHQYAGFSGGYKAFVVGCGSAESIGALHHRDMINQPEVRVGQLLNNPFRHHIDLVGQALPPCTALQWVPGEGWFAGEPNSVLRQASQLSKPFFTVNKAYKTAVIEVPSTKAINFYQASRAATYLALSPRPPLTPDATIVLKAACPEGIGKGVGEQNCAAAMRSCEPPWEALLTGPFPFGGGAQRAIMLARLAQRYTLVVSDCLTETELQAHGLRATHESAEALYSGEALVVSDPFRQLPQAP